MTWCSQGITQMAFNRLWTKFSIHNIYIYVCVCVWLCLEDVLSARPLQGTVRFSIKLDVLSVTGRRPQFTFSQHLEPPGVSWSRWQSWNDLSDCASLFRSKKNVPFFWVHLSSPIHPESSSKLIPHKIIFLVKNPIQKQHQNNFFKRVAREQLRSPVVGLFGWFSIVSRPFLACFARKFRIESWLIWIEVVAAKEKELKVYN